VKTLLLLRHAKSSSKDQGLADFERPLNDHGRKAADLVGRFLAKENMDIDLVISSPAVRARETTELVLRAANRSPELRFDQRIYEATPARLLEVAAQIEDEWKSVLMVGHNPGMEELLTLLVGVEYHMPTATLAKIALNSKKWDQILAEQGVLQSFVKAREL
jgi:phosphohistidine phosphatase